MSFNSPNGSFDYPGYEKRKLSIVQMVIGVKRYKKTGLHTGPAISYCVAM